MPHHNDWNKRNGIMTNFSAKSGRKSTQLTKEVMRQRFAQMGSMDWHLPNPQHAQTTHPVFAHDEEHPDDGQHSTTVLLAPPKLKRPPQYAVVLLNDDYTPMDFVIEILQQYFALDLDRATQVMLQVHHEGKGTAGIYPRDIAETKANQVNNYARSQGHPLLCQIEPQE